MTVFKQRGSRRQADDIFELSFQEASVEVLNNHFQVVLRFAMCNDDLGTCHSSALMCAAASTERGTWA